LPNYVTTTECVGRAMLNVTKRGFPKPVLENRDINVMCAKNSKWNMALSTRFRDTFWIRRIKIGLAAGLPLPGYALLETKGRKTGKPRRTPVGDGRIGNQFWLVAEHGMNAGYVRNIEQNPHVRLKLRNGLRYRWHTGTAHLLTDDDPRERHFWLATQLPSSAGNVRAGTPVRNATSQHSNWLGCL